MRRWGNRTPVCPSRIQRALSRKPPPPPPSYTSFWNPLHNTNTQIPKYLNSSHKGNSKWREAEQSHRVRIFQLLDNSITCQELPLTGKHREKLHPIMDLCQYPVSGWHQLALHVNTTLYVLTAETSNNAQQVKKLTDYKLNSFVGNQGACTADRIAQLV
jgi:hypothetical protein